MDRRRLLLLIAPGLFVLASYTLSRTLRHPVPPAWTENVVDASHVSDVAGISAVGATSQSLRLAVKQRQAEIAELLPENFSTWSAAPFVFAGDVDQATLKRIYRRNVLPASRAMLAEYFDKQPDEAITLLLFSNAQSYEQTAERLFGDRHLSVYGYYRPEQRVVLVNLATGSGTLVHELTHALMDFDYPNAPIWLQEGLASLHEHGEFECVDGDWVLRGRVNWRLKDLLERDRTRWSLAELFQQSSLRDASEHQWYALSRYLCYFLQDQEALATFYRAMRDQQQAATPPGDSLDALAVETLLQSLKANDLEGVELRFRNWVDQLRLPTASSHQPTPTWF